MKTERLELQPTLTMLPYNLNVKLFDFKFRKNVAQPNNIPSNSRFSNNLLSAKWERLILLKKEAFSASFLLLASGV